MSASQPETARALFASHASNATPSARHRSTASRRFVFWRSLASSRRLVLWQSGILALPFAILVALTIYSQFASNHTLAHFLESLCTVILLLLITHSILTASENARLIHEQEQQSVKAELLRKATTSLSSMLELDLLLDHIVSVSATELGFDAAALVLIEEYERPLDEHASLLARATLPDAHQIATWHINGKMLPACSALLGAELEVFWASAAAHPITTVHQWHAEQHLHTSLFVPLSYQGTIQGCLAFSLREERHFTEYERCLVRAFAEEAANAIEHANLYRLAHENALFSQAMSNVAARLNSVVASGMGMGSEIHQLICTEGANALSADLAILYIHGPAGQFIPQAAITSFSEAPTSLEEWPTIPQTAYTSLLVDSLQPCLLQIDQSWHLQPGNGCPATLPPAWEQHTLAVAQVPAVGSVRQLPPTLRPQRVSLIPFKHTNSALAHPSRSITLQNALQSRCVHTAILAPLLIHQNPMGLLVLARFHEPDAPQKRAFASQDLAHAQDFAGQASIAFINARLYQQLSNAHRRMQELDQLKDQFIMTASHELRTPLTAVQGYLELLEHYQGTLSPDQYQEFLQKANRGCEELVLLLNNVMDASRLEIEAGIHPAHFERIAVREVIEHVIDLIGLRATQQSRCIQVHIPSHLMVKADPTHLRQVLLNLSVNALKYSPPGTPLIFSARPLVLQDASVIISVTDRGKGIKPQDQARLFQRFMRLESDMNSMVRGSGLGLYISRRLVEAMQGKIWIESTGTPGEGTTFHVQLARA
ncbi:MAG: GAF domain-containing sensor histidine kinase [Ktedonobacteraceae bacterium]